MNIDNSEHGSRIIELPYHLQARINLIRQGQISSTRDIIGAYIWVDGAIVSSNSFEAEQSRRSLNYRPSVL
jgi:hypothetical protein